MYSDNAYSGSKILNLDQARKLGEAIKASKCLKKSLHPQIMRILKSLTSFKEYPGNDTGFTDE